MHKPPIPARLERFLTPFQFMKFWLPRLVRGK